MDRVRNSGEEVRSVATWVKDLDRRMAEVAEALKKMQANNANIAGIASQVNILAINAKIEAARAGDAGRGFAVVAEAINELSRKTAHAADQIGTNIAGLSKGILAIRDEAAQVASRAGGVIDAANVDLKAFDDGFYRRINGATLQPVLDALRLMREEGVWIEVTNLLIPTLNDDLAMIRLLVPDGVLAYMTCSVLEAENGDQVDAFLSRHPGFQRIDQQAWTPLTRGDGFFLAQLRQG